jgi:hypothetical protein
MVDLPHSDRADGVEAEFQAREEHLIAELTAVHRTVEHKEREIGQLVRENVRLRREILKGLAVTELEYASGGVAMSTQHSGKCVCTSSDRTECYYFEPTQDGKDLRLIDGDCPCPCHDEHEAFLDAEAKAFDSRFSAASIARTGSLG